MVIKGLHTLGQAAFFAAITLPIAIASWLVVFKADPLLWGDYFVLSQVLTRFEPRYLWFVWDHINTIPVLLFITLNKAGIWSYQYQSTITIIIVAVSCHITLNTLKKYSTEKSEPVIIWLITMLLFLYTISYRQMINGIPLVLLEFTALIYILFKTNKQLSQYLVATILCIASTITFSNGVFLWIIAIWIGINQPRDQYKKIFIGTWVIGFIVTILTYKNFVQNGDKIKIDTIEELGNFATMTGNIITPFASKGIKIGIGILLLAILGYVIFDHIRQRRTKQPIILICQAWILFGMLGSVLVILGNRNIELLKYLGISAPFFIGIVLYFYYSSEKTRKITILIMIITAGLQYSYLPKYVEIWENNRIQILQMHACVSIPSVCNIKQGLLQHSLQKSIYSSNIQLNLIEPDITNKIVFSTIKLNHLVANISNEVINKNNGLFLEGTIRGTNCEPINKMIFTDKKKKIIGITSVLNIKKGTNCPKSIKWHTTIKEDLTDTITGVEDILIWVIDDKTNIAYLIQ